MKRLIPAAIILAIIITLCVVSYLCIVEICSDTLHDIDQYYNKVISADTLNQNWESNKEKLAVFANHNFLDKITIYIGQLTLSENSKKEKSYEIYQNIKTILSIIKEEQRPSLHSFY